MVGPLTGLLSIMGQIHSTVYASWLHMQCHPLHVYVFELH